MLRDFIIPAPHNQAICIHSHHAHTHTHTHGVELVNARETTHTNMACSHTHTSTLLDKNLKVSTGERRKHFSHVNDRPDQKNTGLFFSLKLRATRLRSYGGWGGLCGWLGADNARACTHPPSTRQPREVPVTTHETPPTILHTPS